MIRLNTVPHRLLSRFAFLVFLSLSSMAWAGTVAVTTPTNGSTVSSPVHVHATYSASAKYMKLFVDGVGNAVQNSTSTFDVYVSLSAGSHRLVVQAADASTGTVYSSTAIYVTVSTSTSNTITVSPSTATVTEGTTQQFTATDSGGLAVTWTTSCGSITSSGMFTAPNTTGTCTITASDSTGAKGTATATIQPPGSSGQVTITSPVNNSTVANPVHVHATYNGSATYMKLWVDHVDQNLIQYNTNTYDVSVTLSTGPHLLEVQAADSTTGTVYTSAVNITVGSSTTTVTVSPSSASLAPGATQQFTANVPVTWTASGDGSINSSGLFTAGSTTGNATVKATATDGSGATGTASVTVSSSTTPTVTFVTPTTNATVTSPVEVKFTYNQTASYMKLWVDGVAQTAQHDPHIYDIVISLSTGTHTLSAQAHDATSLITYTTNESITVSGTGSSVTISPSTVTLGVNATKQFTANVPVTWSATGDGTINSSGLFTAGSTAGSATVTGTATDGSGATGTANVTVTNGTVVTVSPSTATTQVGATQQFSANTSVTWTASCGAINSSGLFTAPSTTGTCTITATATDGSGATGTATDKVVSAPPSSGNYTTWKNDNLRTGQQRNEKILTPANVNSAHFGILFSESVDAAIYAQPLYMSGLTVNGATHNVVFVATENDSVYAFDADTAGSYLWRTNLLHGGVPVPQANVGSPIFGGIGITSTPVIDPNTNTIYVVTEDLENSTNYIFRLHALDVTTGNEKFGGPVVVSDSNFQPKEQLQRSALLLANGNVYIAFASQGDHSPWNGWVFAYAAGSLSKVAAYNATSTGNGGGIWGGGNAIATDANGDIFVATGNGSWNGTTNLSMSYIRLSPNLSELDYFSPFNEQSLSNSDGDLGAGGLLLVPDQSGTYPHELIGCGKPTPIYVVNRDNMGHLHSGVDSQIIQELPNVVGGTSGTQAGDHCFMSPAYWQGNLYFIGNNDVIKMFKLNGSTGLINSTPSSKGTFDFVFPGAQPVVSSNGSSNGIVWAVDHTSAVALHAFDANNVATQLYQSGSLGSGTKWSTPTVINGKVYVATNGKLYVFASH